MAKNNLHFIPIIYIQIYEADTSEMNGLDKIRKKATGKCNQHSPLSVEQL